MIRFENLAQFVEGIDNWIDETKDLAEATLQGLVSQTFDYILQGTPEWSGNLAANWRVGIGAAPTDYDDVFKDALSKDPTPGARSPYSRQTPNQSALHYARVNAREVIHNVSLVGDVYIANTTPYAYEVETNSVNGRPFIRTVNLPIEMVYAAVDRYNVQREISEVEARAIAAFKI